MRIDWERRREEILAAVDAAEASLARGEGLVVTRDSMQQLAEDVKRRARTLRDASPGHSSGVDCRMG